MNLKSLKPTFAEEKALRNQGFSIIAGVDEVGKGALMGPVVAAAVVLPENIRGRWKSRVRDSKQLLPKEREYLFDFIMEVSVAVGIAGSSNGVIDSIGIARATRLAMMAAVQMLEPAPHFLLIDFVHLDEISIPQKGIVHGDGICFSIACASIIAKVTRDRMVVEMHEKYPDYGFAEHKGYGTRRHLECLRHIGPCPLHRRSFTPVAEVIV